MDSSEALNRVQVRSFSDDGRTIAIAERLQDREVSRKYLVFGQNEKREIECAVPGAAIGDRSNSVTITRYRPGQPSDKPASVQRPDGTVEVYTYDGRNALIATASGQPGFTGTNAVNGTVRRIVRDARDAKTTEETRVLKDGQEGLRIGWQETTKDAFGRPLVTKHLNGTETTRNYDCCGVGTETDAEGSATVHSYDALKRPQSVLRGGIVSSYRYDAAGRRLASYRQGTNGTVVQLDSAMYDLAGRLTAQTNGLRAVTRTEYLTDAAGQSVTVTTQPDGGTRVETYFQDGSLRSVTGTAVSPVRYEYGVDLFGGAQRSKKGSVPSM